MPLYEHVFMARQDVTPQQVEGMVDQFKGVIEQNGGKVQNTEMWGVKTLAFRIKKNRKGHYVLLNLNAPANAIFELERQLKINEDVLRFLTVRVHAFEQSNSSRKRERDERPARRADEPAVVEEGAMG